MCYYRKHQPVFSTTQTSSSCILLTHRFTCIARLQGATIYSKQFVKQRKSLDHAVCYTRPPQTMGSLNQIDQWKPTSQALCWTQSKIKRHNVPIVYVTWKNFYVIAHKMLHFLVTLLFASQIILSETKVKENEYFWKGYCRKSDYFQKMAFFCFFSSIFFLLMKETESLLRLYFRITARKTSVGMRSWRLQT